MNLLAQELNAARHYMLFVQQHPLFLRGLWDKTMDFRKLEEISKGPRNSLDPFIRQFEKRRPVNGSIFLKISDQPLLYTKQEIREDAICMLACRGSMSHF